MSNNPQQQNYTIKLLLIGDQAVGKSSLLNRFIDGTFENLIGTAGLDIRKKIIKINNEEITVKIFDSAGHNRFRNIAQAQAGQVQGLIIVYDVTDLNTLEGAKGWLDSCKKSNIDKKVYVLLGNKTDLVDQIVVKREQGEELANYYGAMFYETSAKDGSNVEEAFLRAVSTLYYEIKEEEKKQNINQGNDFRKNDSQRGGESNGGGEERKKKKSGGCCYSAS